MSFIFKSKVLSQIPLLGSHCAHGEDNLILMQLVRWRKRRWAPATYKSLAYVRKPTLTDPDEMKEIRNRYNIYKSQMKSLRRFLFVKDQVEHDEIHSQEVAQREERRVQYLMVQNDIWNKQTAEIRVRRMAEKEQQIQELQYEKLVKLEEIDADRLEKANIFISKQQELSKTFIKEDQLDLAIEEALNTKKTYNFIIDKDGLVHQELSDGNLSKETVEEQIKKLQEQMQQKPSSLGESLET